MIFAALGHQPTLSLAEISALLGRDVDFSLTSREMTVFEATANELQILEQRSAGLIKLGHIVGELKEWNKDAAADLLSSLIPVEGTGKISFGVSIYDIHASAIAQQLRKELAATGLSVKSLLKESGRSVRYVTSREPVLSSVIIETNHLLTSGGEFVLIATKQGVLVGQTTWIQDFQSWSERDYGRPARDPRSGMLPPKLAHLMINLAGTPGEHTTLLDPFCGSGTVLMEAAVLGFSNLIGGDIEAKAIADTKKNMEWLAQKRAQAPHLALHHIAAQSLPDSLNGQVDLIVTETYLGPPMSSTWHPAAVEKTIRDLQTLYEAVFTRLHSIMKPGAKAVVAFPAFVSPNGARTLMLGATLTKIGFTLVNPSPESIPDSHKQSTPDGGLLYARPNQNVGREILVMVRE